MFVLPKYEAAVDRNEAMTREIAGEERREEGKAGRIVVASQGVVLASREAPFKHNEARGRAEASWCWPRCQGRRWERCIQETNTTAFGSRLRKAYLHQAYVIALIDIKRKDNT